MISCSRRLTLPGVICSAISTSALASAAFTLAFFSVLQAVTPMPGPSLYPAFLAAEEAFPLAAYSRTKRSCLRLSRALAMFCRASCETWRLGLGSGCSMGTLPGNRPGEIPSV